MNASNKMTITRIILTIVIIILCLFPFYSLGINFPKLNINGLVVDSVYFIAGFIYIMALLTNYLDSSIAKKNNTISDRGNLLDKTANEILVDMMLIIFACRGFVPGIVPVVYIFTEEIINFLSKDLLKKGYTFTVVKADRIKLFSIMIGILFMFFYNLPFELLNIKVADFLIYFGIIMSIVSAIEYYNLWKKVK